MVHFGLKSDVCAEVSSAVWKEVAVGRKMGCGGLLLLLVPFWLLHVVEFIEACCACGAVSMMAKVMFDECLQL